MGGKSSAQTVEDSLEAEEIQARFEELASSALGAPPVSSSQAAPLRNTSSVPYSAGKEGEEGRVVLDRWSAILQEVWPTLQDPLLTPIPGRVNILPWGCRMSPQGS